MTGTVPEALDEVPWERLKAVLGRRPAEELRRALRRLVLKGGAATEEDCHPLSDCFGLGTARVSPVATAALPFLVALAADPETGARAVLVQLLANSSRAAAEAGPDRVAVGAGRRRRLRRRRPVPAGRSCHDGCGVGAPDSGGASEGEAGAGGRVVGPVGAGSGSEGTGRPGEGTAEAEGPGGKGTVVEEVAGGGLLAGRGEGGAAGEAGPAGTAGRSDRATRTATAHGSADAAAARSSRRRAARRRIRR
ncbi:MULTISPECIES: hypothetical protein [Streptomyces]|uniref:hypothetical protein n=1 Tax=Streptomyces TaxID=1883 RepID=UPI001409BA79|nr:MULTISPECIES: hypothetical protein [Streptomyces]